MTSNPLPTPASLTEALTEALADLRNGSSDARIYELFSSQQARIEELERQIERRWANGGLPQDVETLRSELVLLRSTALTPEEAKDTLRMLPDLDELEPYVEPAIRSIYSKLSRLATQDQNSQAPSPEQNT